MNFIPLARPDINDEDIQAVTEVLKTGMLVQGQHVLKLEENICKYAGSHHASALSNGTSTLHLALLALGIGAGDEVIVPAFSYVATANVVEIVGATCAFVDIDLKTFNIDVSAIEKAISPKTKAIIPVHEFGLACNIEELCALAEKHNLFVIEDAACALGATTNGRHVGNFGHFGSFSLHPRKAISSGEGGILLTQNVELDKKIKALRNHGISMDSGYMEFIFAGLNYRMTDFQAAMVNTQLKRIDASLSLRKKYAAIYFNEIKNNNLILPYVPGGKEHSWQSFHILVEGDKKRDKVIVQLKEKGIGTNYGAQCIPAQDYYKRKYQFDAERSFPNAFKAYSKGLAIPLYERLTAEEINYIAATLNTL